MIANDAVVINTDRLTPQEVIDEIINLFNIRKEGI
jgi:cytidylate kinase